MNKDNQNLNAIRNAIKVKCLIFILSILIISIFVLGCNFIGAQSPKKTNSNSQNKYYTSIIVEEGDTLWTIANKYLTNEQLNIAEYIKELKQVNQLVEDNIHVGEYLTVPYYVTSK